MIISDEIMTTATCMNEYVLNIIQMPQCCQRSKPERSTCVSGNQVTKVLSFCCCLLKNTWLCDSTDLMQVCYLTHAFSKAPTQQ